MDHSPNIIRVLLADSNVLFRCGMARILESQPDIDVAGETGQCDEILRLVAQLQPDVLLLEIGLDACDTPAVIRQINRECPTTRPVILTNDIEPDELLACALAGAAGYLEKTITPEELFARLRGLVQGEAAMSLKTVAVLLQRLSYGNCTLCLHASPDPDLTPRECDVLALVAQGLTNKAIGAALQISEHTVRNHLCRIYQKLNLKNRLQVAVYSVTHGLVDLEGVV
jgi:DNA-binding NarL/FixJ family response regulator